MGGALTAAGALAIILIGGFEGLRLSAYRDVINKPTICFGETKNVRMGDRKTKAVCERMLENRLVEFSAGVDRCLKRRVPDKSYIAFVSLAYNVGTGAFCRSTLVKKANAGDIKGACLELSKWDRAGGKRVRGLTRRRAEERALCLEGARA